MLQIAQGCTIINECMYGRTLKRSINKINRILLIFYKANKAARFDNNMYSVRYENIWNSDTSKVTIQNFFEIFRILENPPKVNFTKEIHVKCKLSS